MGRERWQYVTVWNTQKQNRNGRKHIFNGKCNTLLYIIQMSNMNKVNANTHINIKEMFKTLIRYTN